MIITGQLLGNCRENIGGNYGAINNLIREKYRAIAEQLPENCRAVKGQLHGNHRDITGKYWAMLGQL